MSIQSIICDKLRLTKKELKPPLERMRLLGAFWQHFALHKIECAGTRTQVISVYSPDCPYPVWNYHYWFKNAEPPSINYDKSIPFFTQAWELFRNCPIPHNSVGNNENCEFTDDYWHSKNCYLSHNGVRCEDLRYSYRTYGVKNSQFAIFSFESENCIDIINCTRCFQVVYAVHSQQCRDSKFLFDCRNCSDCMFCWNLRNKQYCFQNEQLTKEQYFQKIKEWDLTSRAKYSEAISKFKSHISNSAIIKTPDNVNCEEVIGDYLTQCKNAENCFYAHLVQDSYNCVRGEGIKDSLDCIAFDINIELAYQGVMLTDGCYEIKSCFNLASCRYMEYCAFCVQCENCFACCGLVGKEYHIFNKPYSKEDYHTLKNKIISDMGDEYLNFFPGHFAPQPYEESWSGFHMPLGLKDQEKLGFRISNFKNQREGNFKSRVEIPDKLNEINSDHYLNVYWDDVCSKPFKIHQQDIVFYNNLGVPPSDCFYMWRIKQNYSWMPTSGVLSDISCSMCNKTIQTSYDNSTELTFVCEGCYQKTLLG